MEMTHKQTARSFRAQAPDLGSAGPPAPTSGPLPQQLNGPYWVDPCMMEQTPGKSGDTQFYACKNHHDLDLNKYNARGTCFSKSKNFAMDHSSLTHSTFQLNFN